MVAICYKCKGQYESDDASDIAGDGFCSPCVEAKKAIAAEIDARFANRPPTPKKPSFDELPKVQVGGITFINSKYLN